MLPYTRHILLAIAAVVVVPNAHAQLVNLGPGAFTPLATAITFDEAGRHISDVNPVYDFTGVPGIGNVTVSFAGAFTGQSVVGSPVRTLAGNPTGPLSLNTAAITYISPDVDVPSAPVLSGSPQFNGPIVMLFSHPVAAVGLQGGYFNAVGGTSITAYDANGNPLGTLANSQTGLEFFGLADASGNNVISGLAFYITGNEPFGFDIDDVTFGSRAAVNLPASPVPEPSTLALMATGLAAVGVAVRHRPAMRRRV